MSGEFGHVTVVVLQKVPVDRHVGPAVYHVGKRPVSPVRGTPVPVRYFTIIGPFRTVNRRGVHLGGQYSGKSAVLSHVCATVCRRHHRRQPFVDHEPKREPVKVPDPRPQYVWNTFQWPKWYVHEPAVDGVVCERIENFDYGRCDHDYSEGKK